MMKRMTAICILAAILITGCDIRNEPDNHPVVTPEVTDASPQFTAPPEVTDASPRFTAPVQLYRAYGHFSDDYRDPEPVKVTSAAELLAYYEACFPDGEGYAPGYYEDDIPPNDPAAISIFADLFQNNKYKEAFFDERFLIFAGVYEPSGSIRHKVNSVTAENGCLTVNIHSLKPLWQTDDMAYWIIVMELDRKWSGLDVTITRSEELWTLGG